MKSNREDDFDSEPPGEICVTGNGQLIHRDDLPFEIVEELEEKFADLFPGMKVRFAGDLPDGEVPQNVLDALAAINQKHDTSLVSGSCLDCGRTMPGFDLDEDEFDLPPGWRIFNGDNGEPCAFQCPECDTEDNEEPFRLRRI